MLSNASKYAIRAVLYLAMHSNKSAKIGVTVIANTLVVPQPFLAKLLQQLTRNGYVSSAKGPNGGFFLSDEDLQNSIWDILTCIDGPDKFKRCFLGLEVCNDENPCPAHVIVAPFKAQLFKDFKDKSIGQYAADVKANGQVISLKAFDVPD